jgi:hypothetical protein
MSRRPPRVPGMSSRPRTIYLLPSIPDELDERTKDGLAIRNAASASGVCPSCGATGDLRGPDDHGFMHLVFEHELVAGEAA